MWSCADRTSIAQQSAPALASDQSFISYVCEHVAFNTHKARAAASATARALELAPASAWTPSGSAAARRNFCADDGHRGGDLRTDVGFQVRAIMRVLDHHAVESGILVLRELPGRRST